MTHSAIQSPKNPRVSPPSQLALYLSRLSPSLLLFFSVWFIYGALTNSSNLKEFNLQQLGVEAIVERSHFYVEGSATPQIKDAGDTFEYNDHLYPAKQPGQFLAGAVVYFFLHLLGLSYLKSFLMTAALVTWLTGGLMTALAAVVVFHLARDLLPDRVSPNWALAIALAFGLASTAFAYSGIAYHDAIAPCYLIIGFYLIFRLAHGGPTIRAPWLAAGAGLMLGLTITTSMLPFFMALVVGLYFLSLRQWRLLPFFILGGLAGLTPLLVYDTINFGNPLLLPNIAGNYSDTFFKLDWGNFISKIQFYLTFITLYVPVFWWGIIGLLAFPGQFRREQIFLGGAIVLLLGYILNIDADGYCGYGPRFLLPAMPFAALGLVGLLYISLRPLRSVLGITALIAGVLSAIINFTGALLGAMYCDLKIYAFTRYLVSIQHGKFWTMPLMLWLAIPLALCIIGLVISIRQQSILHKGSPGLPQPA